MAAITATILSGGQEMDQLYELLSLDITKEVNRIPDAELMLLDGSLAEQTFAISNSSFFEPGKLIEVQLRYEGEPDTTVFSGLVMKQSVALDRHGSALTVSLKDTAIKLTFARNSIVYRDKTDDAICKDIISKHGLRAGQLTATQPEHLQLVQYDATDWDFLVSRAEANGLFVVADDGEISLPPIAIEGEAKQRFTVGLSDIYNFEMEVDTRHQHATVQSFGWDPKEQKVTPVTEAKAFTLSQGNLDPKKLATGIGADKRKLTHLVPLDRNELQAWADASMARSRMSLLRGRLSVAGSAEIKLLDVVEIDGIGERFNGKTVVTGLRHRLSLNGWQTDIQFGLSADWFSSQTNIMQTPAAGLVPGVNGLQVGIVDDFEEDPDSQFRIKVILPSLDKVDEAVWARLAFPEAGGERGYFFWPEPGDEVVVGFFNDDPRQAVILGSLYSAKNIPPAAIQLTPDNNQKGIVTKAGTVVRFDDEKPSVVVETPGGNIISLDDDEAAITLSDQHGNRVVMNSNGVEISSAKDVTIEASGNVVIIGQAVDVK